MTDKDASTAESAAKSRRNGVSGHFRQVFATEPHGKGGMGRYVRSLNDLDPKTSQVLPRPTPKTRWRVQG